MKNRIDVYHKGIHIVSVKDFPTALKVIQDCVDKNLSIKSDFKMIDVYGGSFVYDLPFEKYVMS